MLRAIIKRLRHDKHGISNVIVVMLSLVLIVIIVGNVILWSYQMNQLDLERMQENLKITSLTRITRSSWFTAQKEFAVSAGSKLSGAYTDTTALDNIHETFREEKTQVFKSSNYVLGGSTSYVSGEMPDLNLNDDLYMCARAQFELKVDWVEFEATTSDMYRLCVSNNFVIDLSTYPLNYIHGIEILARYNVSENTEKWFLKAYNWAASSFSDIGFNTTEGSQPLPNEWNEYAISLTDSWADYVRDDGTLLVEFLDEGLNTNQSMVEVDFFGVRAIVDGTCVELKNSSSLTVHVVAAWIVNSTNHQRYDADLFINSGEEVSYTRIDISLPRSNFLAKVVTERGNVSVFTGS